MKISEMTNKQLKKEFEATDQMINISSYGVNDVIYLNQLEQEIENRGLEIIKKVRIK